MSHTTSYGSFDVEPRTTKRRRWLGLCCVLGLFWVTAVLVERRPVEAPRPTKPKYLPRKARRQVRRALRDRGRDLRSFFKLLKFEKRYLALWTSACGIVDDGEDEFCGDYDDFCPVLCREGTRCHKLCGDACQRGAGVFCMLSYLHDLDALCHARPIVVQSRQPAAMNLSSWLNDTSCAVRSVCQACHSMDSWGCQKATHAAATSFHRDHPDDPTLAEYDFDPHSPQDPARWWIDPAFAYSISNSTDDDNDLLPLNATTLALLFQNISLVDPFLRPDVWPLVAAQFEGDDLCSGATVFPDLPSPPPLLDVRSTTFPFDASSSIALTDRRRPQH